MVPSHSYKADIAASAKVISWKFPEIPLWHIHVGSWVYVGKWKSSWLLFLCYIKLESLPEGQGAGSTGVTDFLSLSVVSRVFLPVCLWASGGCETMSTLQPGFGFEVSLEPLPVLRVCGVWSQFIYACAHLSHRRSHVCAKCCHIAGHRYVHSLVTPLVLCVCTVLSHCWS